MSTTVWRVLVLLAMVFCLTWTWIRNRENFLWEVLRIGILAAVLAAGEIYLYSA